MHRNKGQVYDPPRRTRGRPDWQSECKGTEVNDIVLLLPIVAVNIEDSSGTNGQSGASIPSVRFPILAILLRTYTWVVENAGSSES